MNAECLKETGALHVAAVYGFADVVKVLLDKGADVNARMQGDVTALHLAAANGLRILFTVREEIAIVQLTEKAIE